jgi:hypothetical protein
MNQGQLQELSLISCAKEELEGPGRQNVFGQLRFGTLEPLFGWFSQRNKVLVSLLANFDS